MKEGIFLLSRSIKNINCRDANYEKDESQSLGEEIASSVTHGIGAALSIAAFCSFGSLR